MEILHHNTSYLGISTLPQEFSSVRPICVYFRVLFGDFVRLELLMVGSLSCKGYALSLVHYLRLRVLHHWLFRGEFSIV